MRASDVLEFLRKPHFCPEVSFLYDMKNAAREAEDPGTLIGLPSLSWCGAWSGNRMENLTNVIAPKIVGEVQAIFTWEGGDSVSGLAIKHGKVAECEVVQTLKLPDGW